MDKTPHQEWQSPAKPSPSPDWTKPGAAAGSPQNGIKPASHREFKLLRQLIYREAGIFLPDTKQALLERRLTRRLKALGLSSFGAYYRMVSAKRAVAERVLMLDAITTNETQFFREPRQFEFLEKTLIPAWLADAESGGRHRRLRVWSAACSTGEEPYSLAMVLRHHLKAIDGWNVEILATDLSTEALAHAEAAVWPIEKVRDIPERFLKQFMLRGKRSQIGKIRAGRELRSMMRFERLNLHRASYPVVGPFDLIFCRNVLIYFDSQSKLGVLNRLLRSLAPDGHLFVGHAESLTSLSQRVKTVIPTVYKAADAAPRGSN